EELVNQRIVLREKGSRTRSIFEEAVSRAGQELHDVMEIGGREGVREAVAAGFGIGIVAENELLADSRLRALPVNNADLAHAEYVVCLKELRDLRVSDAFLEMVRASHRDAGPRHDAAT
ncbi:MAG: LysR substrate-binding domain-containing protein, partial [Gammaproteobacteria bacterium]